MFSKLVSESRRYLLSITTDGSLFEQKQHCDDGKLKSCVGQASNKFLGLDQYPQTDKPLSVQVSGIQACNGREKERLLL